MDLELHEHVVLSKIVSKGLIKVLNRSQQSQEVWCGCMQYSLHRSLYKKGIVCFWKACSSMWDTRILTFIEWRISSLKLVLQFQLSQITMPSVSNYLSLPAFKCSQHAKQSQTSVLSRGLDALTKTLKIRWSPAQALSSMWAISRNISKNCSFCTLNSPCFSVGTSDIS